MRCLISAVALGLLLMLTGCMSGSMNPENDSRSLYVRLGGEKGPHRSLLPFREGNRGNRRALVGEGQSPRSGIRPEKKGEADYSPAALDWAGAAVTRSLLTRRPFISTTFAV